MKSKKVADVEQKRCAACGECIFVCPKGAVSIMKGCYAIVNKDVCIGCGKCSRFCPVSCIAMMERQVEKNEEE